jgi:hypothetical protein
MERHGVEIDAECAGSRRSPVMNYVILSRSAGRVTPHFSPESFIEDILAMLLFGTIVAFFARARDR